MHIERVDTEDVEGLLSLPDIWIEPKLDGANASVLLDENGILTAGKRSQVLGQGDDFRGLKAHVYEHQDKFMAFFERFPAHIIYGEWLIPHTIKYYREDAWHKFYAFDIMNGSTGEFVHTETRLNLLKEFDINQVPPICKVSGPLVSEQHMKQLQWYADNNKYLIDDPNKTGEGIVVKGFTKEGKAYVNKYGRTVWAKIVRQEFKEKNAIAMGIPDKNFKTDYEKLFAEEYITEGRVEKIKQKITTEKGTGWKSQYIGELLGRTWHDVFTEELWKFVKKNKVKTVNFKTMEKYVVIKTKEVAGI